MEYVDVIFPQKVGVLTYSVPPRLRGELRRGEAILWSPGRGGLRPLRVGTGLVGEKMTEVRGEHIEEGVEVALPETRKDRSPRRHRGWRLF